MKWRDRISILSRKRNCGGVGAALNRQAVGPSCSGPTLSTPSQAPTSSTESKVALENTLSQLRPVIGPDHKSYYILLRGNEDSFTCIQPAKDVMNNLDDMMKNVANSVKLVKALPHGKKHKYNRAKTYPKLLTQKDTNSAIRKSIEISEPVLHAEQNRTESSVNTINLFPDRAGGSPVIDSVVDNVLLNRTTVQSVNFDQSNRVSRTNPLLYPLVQNSLEPNDLENLSMRQESCLFIPNNCSGGDDSESLIVPNTETDLIQSIVESNASFMENRECSNSQSKTISDVEDHLTPDTHSTPETYLSEEAVMTQVSHLHDHHLQECPPMADQSFKPVELSLIAREGAVLSEQEITSEIKNLIESEQLVVGDNSQIVVIR